MSKIDKPLPVVDIDANVKAFFDNPLGNYCLPDERNASFDYCYNYFQGFRERGEISKIASPENLEMSCLQIGFYLASWGMLRGSAFLSKRSVHHYKKLIKVIANEMDDAWAITMQEYENDAGRQKILSLAGKVRRAISLSGEEDEDVSKILITKIMLGVFGNIPAFDSFFERGFGTVWLDLKSLERIYNYYKDNEDNIKSYKIYTLDFLLREQTNLIYPQAKIIDMIFFMEGDKKSKAEKAAEEQAKS